MNNALTIPALASHVVQFVWPIVDEELTQAELVAEGEAELDAFVDARNAVVAGPPMWTVRDAADIAGWGAYAPGLVLIAVAPVTVTPTANDAADLVAVDEALCGRRINLSSVEQVEAIRQGATVHHLSDRQIGDRLRIPPKSIAWKRTVHGIPAGVPSSRAAA